MMLGRDPKQLFTDTDNLAMNDSNPSATPISLINETRWQQVVDRIPSELFVYAVTTTGIYCRSGCASRLPKREHVSFYETSALAEQAGYRACKRCQPTLPQRNQVPDPRITLACEQLDATGEATDLKTLAQATGLSLFHFQRLFKKSTGVTPKQYLAERRRQKLQQSLQTDLSITDALYQSGFNSSSRLYEQSNHLLGMTPSQYKRGGVGLSIQYAIMESFLGQVLVAATDRGICSVDLDQHSQALQARLQERFPKAKIQEGDATFSRWISEVLACIQQPGRSLNLPMDIQGTAFQRRVWQALQDIPPGTTRTYSQLAEQLGQPKSVRAVANACASNPVAILIPCHRVIGKDGKLHGYRWGLERKQCLLTLESSLNHTPDTASLHAIHPNSDTHIP